jgi:hypothetical protein
MPQALRSVMPGQASDVAQLRARWRAMRSNARAWLVTKLQLATL